MTNKSKKSRDKERGTGAGGGRRGLALKERGAPQNTGGGLLPTAGN